MCSPRVPKAVQLVVVGSGGEGLDGRYGTSSSVLVEACGDVVSEVAAAFGPFVVLFGEDGAGHAAGRD
jgi:hypothetical protein